MKPFSWLDWFGRCMILQLSLFSGVVVKTFRKIRKRLIDMKMTVRLGFWLVLSLSIIIVALYLMFDIIPMILILMYIATVAMFLYGLYLLGKIYIPRLAEEDKFFSSPKLGRIKAVRVSGRIVGFIDNLIGKRKHVNHETGKIEPKEVKPSGFWWRLFGVRFIGLNDVYQYQIATSAVEVEEGEKKGELKYEEKPASSIFYEGTYPVRVILNTADGILLRVKLRIKTTTVDAAKALSLPVSWTIPMFDAVIAANRDHFGSKPVKELINAQNEGGRTVTTGSGIEKDSGYVKRMKDLNNNKAGNVPLAKVCGQRIDAVNVVDADFVKEEDRKAFMAPYVAEQEAQEEVKKADAYAKALKTKTDADKLAADAIASAIEKKGAAENTVHVGKVAAYGGNASAAANVSVAENQSKMQNLKTLVNGRAALVSVQADQEGE